MRAPRLIMMVSLTLTLLSAPLPAEAQPCSFTAATRPLSPLQASVYRTGGTGTVTVMLPSGCPWMATSDVSWITIISGATGSGNGTVTYAVAANSGPSRSGTITIAGDSVTITQPNDLNPENVSILMSDFPGNRLARFSDLAGTNWETGPAGSAGSLNGPWHISFDAQGRIYVADRFNRRIVRMDEVGGSGWKTFSGVGTNTLDEPASVTFDSAGRIYIVDTGSRVVRIDDMDGAGWTTFGPTPSGPGSFLGPKVVILDRQGRLYVSDTGNNRIVRFNDLQGTGWITFGSQGSGVGQFNRPEGLALDSLGRIYITDNENHRIVRIDDMTGAGWVTYGSFGSGVNQVWEPHDIAISDSGRIYIADTGNGRVVRIDDMTGAGWAAFGTHTLQTGSPGTNNVAPGLFEFIAPKGIRLTPTALLPLTHFVTGFYQNVLGREPEPAGLAGWADFLRAHCNAQGFDAIARGFFDSLEFRTVKPHSLPGLVTLLYRTFLGRDPDPGGLAGWAGLIRQARLTMALQGFIPSQEFQSLLPDRTNRTAVTAVVTRLYQQVLGRDPEPAGLQGWVDFIVATGRLEDAATGFLASQEFESHSQTARDYVSILYQTFLNRAPDAGGLDFWEAILRDTLLQIINAGFVPSQEFQGLLPQVCG